MGQSIHARYRRLLLAFAAAVLAVFFAMPTLPARAAINPIINFQGKLTNPDGTNVTNGTYSIVFAIYTVSSGGSAVWSETQGSVSVTDGIFQVSLGSVTALPGSVDFNSSPLYLGIKVGADAEMTPRIQLTAAPYAFNSDRLGGIASSGFAQLGPTSAQADASTNSAIFINKTAAGNLMQLQSSAVDAFTITSTGSLTFGQNAAKTISVAQTGTNAAGQNLTVVPGQGGAGAGANAGGDLVLQGGTGGGTNGTGGNVLLGGGAGNGAGASGTVTVQNAGNSATAFTVLNATSVAILSVNTTNSEVTIGSATTDTTQILLQVDSFDTFAETASCGTADNQGSMYYNTRTNAMRGCIGGAWEDMISTAGLGLQLFGVVPDSGTNPGDLAAVTGNQNGPCKVSVGANTTTVSWTGCTAYSGGRKVIVAAGTATTANTVAARFQHLCLTGPNGQPALSASGVETANLATVSMPSVTAPILCLADIRFAAANNTITQIYDTRTYTTTDKVPVTVTTTAPALGHLVQFIATKGTVQPMATLNGNAIAGVLVATTGATSTTTINGIMAYNGPAAVKAITGTNLVNAYIFGTATAGYAGTVATKPAEGTGTIYNVLGNARTAWTGAAACTANNDTCAGSIFTYIDKR